MPITCSNYHPVHSAQRFVILYCSSLFTYPPYVYTYLYGIRTSRYNSWKFIPKLKQNNGLGRHHHHHYVCIYGIYRTNYMSSENGQNLLFANRHLSPSVSLPFIFPCLTFISIQVEVNAIWIYLKTSIQAYIVNNIIHSTTCKFFSSHPKPTCTQNLPIQQTSP